MEKTIKKAIEGGWRPSVWDETIETKNGATQIKKLSKSEIREQPLFWQALGKAEGWGKIKIDMDDYIDEHHFMGGTLRYPYNEGGSMKFESEAWKYQWHRFIDHLAEGKDPDSFFESLLSK